MNRFLPQPSDVEMLCEHIRSTAFSHIGLVRTANEDRILDDGTRGLFAVADGMGGHSLGDWAATTVVQALVAANLSEMGAPAILRALYEANRIVYAKAQERGVTCGSTVAGLSVSCSGEAFLFWAGDSRIYRLRKGILERLSRDHSVVQELLDAGVLDEDQAKNHPRGHVITRAIGVTPAVEIETRAIDYATGDVYLLCSDGISGAIGDGEIASLLRAGSIATAATALRNAALHGGGKDNLSAVLVAT